MKVLSCAVLSCLCASFSQVDATNPIAKVLDLLAGLQQKVIKEGETEMNTFQEFSEWCEETARNAQFSIKTLTSQKDELMASISQLAGSIEASTAKIEKLSGNLNTLSHDTEQAAKIRKDEKSEFKAVEGELMEDIDMLGRAVSVLGRMAKPSFAQINELALASPLRALQQFGDVISLSTHDAQRLQALVQEQNSDDSLGAPSAAVYESHSGGIVETLEGMKDKAESQLSDLRKTEMESEHEYQLLAQSLSDETKADTKDMESTKAHKAGSQESKAKAEGNLARTEADLKNTKADLEETRQSCMKTARDHESAVAARTEELNALAKAKQIIKDTSSGAVGQTYSFLQTGMQLKTREDMTRVEIVTMLRKLARDENSASLTQLAARVASISRFSDAGGEDQFSKIKGLIRDMISRLEDEADADATEKAYCDKELAYTVEKRTGREEDQSKLTAKIDQASARSAELKEQVKTLQEELGALVQSQAELDKLRSETHADYEVAKKDLELGLSGVRQALEVLNNYYAASLLQQTHTKSTGAGQGIIGMLEVIEADFSSGLAKEETAEEDAQNEYEKITKENEITRTSKEQDVKYKTQESESLDKEVSELNSDLETTNSELASIVEYHNSLKKRCIAKPETYEERVRRRQAELAGLKEALTTLEEETALLQRKSRKDFSIRGALMLDQ